MNKINLVILIILLSLPVAGSVKMPGRTIVPDSINARSFCVSPSQTHIFSTRHNHVNIYEIATGQKVFTYANLTSSSIQSLELTTDSSLLIAGTRDGELVIHDMHKAASSSVKLHDKMITSLAVDLQNDLIVAGDFEGALVFLNTTGHIKHVADVHQGVVTDLEIVDGEKIVVSSSFDGKIIKTNYKEQVLNSEVIFKKTPPSRAIAINNEANRILTAYDNSWIYQFRISRENQFDHFEKKRLSGWISSLSYSKRNKLVWACATTDGKVRIYTTQGEYRLDTGKTINQIYLLETDESMLSVLVNMHDGGIHYIAAKDMKLYL